MLRPKEISRWTARVARQVNKNRYLFSRRFPRPCMVMNAPQINSWPCECSQALLQSWYWQWNRPLLYVGRIPHMLYWYDTAVQIVLETAMSSLQTQLSRIRRYLGGYSDWFPSKGIYDISKGHQPNTFRPWAGYRPPSPPGGILYTMIFWNYII